MHGRGLFHRQASVQIRIPLKICQHLVVRVVCVYIPSLPPNMYSPHTFHETF